MNLVHGITFLSLTLIAAVWSQACGKPAITPKINERIAGGIEAKPGSWPWIAHLGSLQGTEEHHFYCAASIISNKFVVTAVHCLWTRIRQPDGSTPVMMRLDLNATNYILRMGQFRIGGNEASTKDYTIKRVIPHENYTFNPDPSRYDIAILELENAIEFNDHISPVCLPAPQSDPVGGTNCVAAGWGMVAEGSDSLSPTLQQVELKVIKREKCTDTAPEYVGNVSEDMLCAGDVAGQNACKGDSGGPLVCRTVNGQYILEGIVSWSHGCALAGYPGVFSRTGYSTTWIKQQTGIESVLSDYPTDTGSTTERTSTTASGNNFGTRVIPDTIWSIFPVSVALYRRYVG